MTGAHGDTFDSGKLSHYAVNFAGVPVAPVAFRRDSFVAKAKRERSCIGI
jgi:hypothetical protein